MRSLFTNATYIVFTFFLTGCVEQASEDCYNDSLNYKLIPYNSDSISEYHFKNKNKTDSIIMLDHSCNVIEKSIYTNEYNTVINNFFVQIKNNPTLTIYDMNNPNRSFIFRKKKRYAIEFYIIDSIVGINRFWQFDENLDIVQLKSNYFSVNLQDTIDLNDIVVGNIGVNLNYKRKYDLGKFYESPQIIFGKGINRSFKNLNKIEVDTFVTLNNEFYFEGLHKGYQHFRGVIIDEYFHSSEKMENGEINMIHEENFYYIDERIFVK